MSRRESLPVTIRGTLLPVALAIALVGVALLGGTATGEGQAADGTESRLEIVATYPTDDGQQRETVLTASDFESVGEVEQGESGRYHVPVTLTNASATHFAERMRETGFTDDGVGSCRYPNNPENPGYCLLTVLDGDVVYSASMSSPLAAAIREGDFEQTRAFLMLASNESQAESIREAIRQTTPETPAETTDGLGDTVPTPGLGGPVAVVALVVALALLFVRRRP